MGYQLTSLVQYITSLFLRILLGMVSPSRHIRTAHHIIPSIQPQSSVVLTVIKYSEIYLKSCYFCIVVPSLVLVDLKRWSFLLDIIYWWGLCLKFAAIVIDYSVLWLLWLQIHTICSRLRFCVAYSKEILQVEKLLVSRLFLK